MTASSTEKTRPASAKGLTGSTVKGPVTKSRQFQQQPGIYVVPAAGAHAAAHLINEDATPGAGVLPSHAYVGKEVDGAAG